MGIESIVWVGQFWRFGFKACLSCHVFWCILTRGLTFSGHVSTRSLGLHFTVESRGSASDHILYLNILKKLVVCKLIQGPICLNSFFNKNGGALNCKTLK